MAAEEENRAASQKGAVDLPLRIGGDLVVRSALNPSQKVVTKVIGAIQGNFILITQPAIELNERLTGVLEGDFLCSYFDSGYLYTFQSKFRHHVFDNIVSIDYPDELEIKQIRKHRRIKVNIETEFCGAGSPRPLSADMIDISHGGCCLNFSPIMLLNKGMSGSITFGLPNKQIVNRLKCQVMSVHNSRSGNTTRAGIRFIGPVMELDKVAAFCELCMYFELD